MKYFGTDGFRGEANVNLNAAQAYRIGRYLGHYYKNEGAEERAKIVIGKDTRRSSYMLESALAAGITSSGTDAYLLHVTPTPNVSHAVQTGDFACGIMISASHNPFQDNGIKLMDGDGAKMGDDFLEDVEEYIDRKEDDLPLAHREELGEVRDYVFGRNRYMAYLISTVRSSFKRIKVGLDTANGAAFTIAKSIFDSLGADTYVIHDRPDGTNINVDSGSTHIDQFVDFVKEKKLDVGFAFDGDADRCIAVDNKGQIVDGDAILYICGSYMKEKGDLVNNTVVTTVMSNMGLYKALEDKGIDYTQTDVGDRYVTQEMLDKNFALGGEQSGHIIFSKYATTGDGILTALRLMEVMIDSKTDLASLHQELVVYPQVLKNIKVKDKQTVLENKVINDEISRLTEALGEDGRILVRPSGTEPLIRVMAEAKDEKTCQEVVESIIQKIHDEGLVEE